MIVYPELRIYGYSLQLENSSTQKNNTTLHYNIFVKIGQ